MYRFYNANPLGRKVNDCTVRAISLATGRSWGEVYDELCSFARAEATMPDDVLHIDGYLKLRYPIVCDCKGEEITIGEFVLTHPRGTYLITMTGHITCAKDGTIYDTFDPSSRYVWEAYQIN